MPDTPEVNTAIDAVRCLYLARVAERKGYPDAAQRWQQLAEGWLNRLQPNTARFRSRRTASPDPRGTEEG